MRLKPTWRCLVAEAEQPLKKLCEARCVRTPTRELVCEECSRSFTDPVTFRASFPIAYHKYLRDVSIARIASTSDRSLIAAKLA